MRKEMKRKLTGSVIVILSAVLTAGCGNAIPALSEAQQELVVEYAAGVLLKHDQNHENRLVELTMEEEETDEANNVPENDRAEEELSANTGNQEENINNVPVIDNTQTVVNENVSIESFLNLDSVKITYTGYETTDFYPDQSDEFFFVMNSSEGNKLLILKFLTENLSGTDVSVDIAQSNTRFKIAVDGVEKNALTTMLLNDMPYYQGTLAPGESTELVVVCEVPDEQAGMISSLKLVLKNAENTAAISLY